MYQAAISSSSTPTAPLLHPRVRQALAYLDCQLEDELLRYRRARSGSRVAPSSSRLMWPSSKPKTQVELVQFVPIGDLSKPDGLEASRLNSIGSGDPVQNGITDEKRTSNDLEADFHLDSATPLAQDVLANLAVIPEDNGDGDSGYSLDDLMNHAGMEFLGDRHSPDDYLESSEELLRSLAQEEANVEQERSHLEGLLTPLGIGSMLLMLMGSGMFGYLVMNPSTLTAFGSGLTRLVSGFSGKPNATPPVVAEAPAQGGGEVPKESSEFMDLSLKNLVVMGTQGKGTAGLKVLPSIAPKPNAIVGRNPSGIAAGANGMPNLVIPGQPAPGSGPSSAVTGNSSQGISDSSSQAPSNEPSSVQAPPQPAPHRPSLYRPVQPKRSAAPARSAEPQPVKTVPMALPPAPSTPTSIPPAIESGSTPTPTGGYRVEIPYTGDTALEKAQQADSGAFFKNGENGAVIQMGETYSSREAAEAKAQQLKQQGFEGAEVQK